MTSKLRTGTEKPLAVLVTNFSLLALQFRGLASPGYAYVSKSFANLEYNPHPCLSELLVAVKFGLMLADLKFSQIYGLIFCS